MSERRLNFKPSIDVRGQRVDEAMDNVSHFVDDALMVGMGEGENTSWRNGENSLRKFANTLRRWAEFSLQRTKTCKWAGPE